ncbi:MAG TPA: D-alanyl-D-alanine carboxypeptidase/D-alanyl-D-alanine-endopeptidase [Micromonosporaceae bacterium]|nr:D-alanyl-D-alanine carboxypeptidase/D-alanyl-D-alanine-endopeptidase [Micromonosporaceae bacterium]
MIGLVLAVVALALAATGAVVPRPGPVAGWLGAGPDPKESSASAAEPPPPPVLSTVAANAPMPSPEGIRAALEPLITASGIRRVNLSVLDVATGQPLYERGAQVMTVPASTTKLATAAAVLSTRGPAYRIATRVVAGQTPGEVVLVGGGDPTLAVDATRSYPGAARLDRLAADVKRALGGQPVTKVTVDVSLFSGPRYEPAWDPGTPNEGYGAAITALMTNGARVDPKQSVGQAERVPQPDLAAGRSFARLLGVPEEAVARGKAPAAAGPPAGASAAATASPGSAGTPGAELGRVESPPVLRLVEFMLGESDNVVAEFLARQVALARGQPASFVGAAAAVDAVLADLTLDAGQSALADGSGLSRANRITPALLARILALSADPAHPELAGVAAGLPVAAWSGTLRDRYGTAPGGSSAAGVVRAKTGTLSGVHSLAGMVTTADGRLLAFAIMADDVPVTLDARPRIDRMAATLAACGCR